MKTLTLVRHAKSSWKDRTLTDRERPLNKRGKNDAPVMAERITDAGIRPSLIVSSPAVRAWTTAKIVAQAIGYPLEFLQREDRLYLASLDNWLDIVAAQDEGFNNLMLFGHNPGLTDFANYLSPGLTSNVPTAGVVCVEVDSDDWLLYERPKTELVLYDYPKKQH
ncbi:MAG TPA: histidine phosphatase family protein [Woeseiaceae bacterium]|jgi:phosphohistidine phosphatase|nr:histidine phosphatase family protein [Woeseiaceae bacterium]